MMVRHPKPPISPLRAWLMAVRPRTLPAAVAPVIVGTALAYADYQFHAIRALAALAVALLLQIGVNLANDYFDCVKGVDTPERLGPPRVTQSGLIAPQRVKIGMVAVLGLAFGVGVYLVYCGGWPILLAGLASLLAALAYSGGPYPLASHGLGDLFVFLFFGLVAVCGTYYVQALKLTPLVVIAAVQIGFLVTAILVVNNLRDIPTDRKTGKHTMAVMIGVRGTVREYALLVICAYGLLVAIYYLELVSAWVFLPLATLPLAWTQFKIVHRRSGPALNPALGGTAQLSVAFSLLLAIGLVMG